LKGNEKFKGKWHQRGKDLKVHVRKRMLFLKVSLMELRRDMGHILESNKIEVTVEDCCSIGFAEMIITRIIFPLYQGGKPHIYRPHEA